MAIKFEKIKEGMTLWDVRRNTSMTRNKWSAWPVRVLKVHEVKRTVLASWNHNTPVIYSEKRITKLRAKQPKQENKY